MYLQRLHADALAYIGSWMFRSLIVVLVCILHTYYDHCLALV